MESSVNLLSGRLGLTLCITHLKSHDLKMLRHALSSLLEFPHTFAYITYVYTFLCAYHWWLSTSTFICYLYYSTAISSLLIDIILCCTVIVHRTYMYAILFVCVINLALYLFSKQYCNHHLTI